MVKNLVVPFFLCVSFFLIGYLVGINKPMGRPASSVAQTQLIVTNNSLLLLNQTIPTVIIRQERGSEPVYRERDLLDIVHQSFYRQALDLLIETMSVSDLVPLTAFVSGFDTDFLWQMQRPHSFAKSLVSLYMEGCGDIEIGEDPSDPIRFADQADNHTAAEPSPVFNLGEVGARIYAYFVLPADYDSDEVLVRWCSPAKNVLYGPYVIDRTRPFNYVWWEPFRLETGNYYVYIWTVNQQPELITSGYYEVVE